MFDNKIPGLKKIEKSILKVDSKIEKINQDPTRLYHSSFSFIYRNIIIKFFFIILLWIIFLKYIGFLDPDKLFSLLLSISKFFFKEDIMILGLKSSIILKFIFLWFIYMFIIDFPIVFLLFYIVAGGKLNNFWKNLFKIQFFYPLIVLMIFTATYFIIINLSFGISNSPTQNMGYIVNQSISNIKNSQTLCILKYVLSGKDISLCDDLGKKKKAQLSSKIKYSVSLLDLFEKNYAYTHNNLIRFDYKILSKGASLKVLKFECYENQFKKDHLISSEIFKNKTINTGDNPIIENFVCDLTKLKDHNSSSDMKILPVIYFEVQGEMVMEMPIVVLDDSISKTEYYKLRDKYITAFSDIKPIISDDSFQASVRWSPYFPLFSSKYDSNKIYNAIFSFKTGGMQNYGSSLGKVIKYKFLNIFVPNYLNYKCGDIIDNNSLGNSKNDCLKQIDFLNSNNTKTFSEINFPISFSIKKDQLTNYKLNYIIFNYLSEFRYISSVLISFKNE